MPEPIIPVATARQRLGLAAEANHRDAEIRDLLHAAIAHVEDLSGHILQRREIDLPLTVAEDGTVAVHAWPIAPADVATITYQDAAGVEWEAVGVGLNADFSRRPGLIYSNAGSWPTNFARGGVARVTAGYATLDEIPPKLVQAVLILVGQWFADPTGERDVSAQVKALCSSFRTF
jgi:uncharacterized phiE125 gp8 family phage protein